MHHITRTYRQPNYPKQLGTKRGSQSSLLFDPNPKWWAKGGNLSIVQAGDTLSRELYQPIVLAFDRTFDHLQLIRSGDFA